MSGRDHSPEVVVVGYGHGHNVLASRLGYRITLGLVERCMGRIFETPDTVFSEEMLRPEKQDRALFTREALLASDWYQARLGVKQGRDVALWRRHLAALEAFRRSANSTPVCH